MGIAIIKKLIKKLLLFNRETKDIKKNNKDLINDMYVVTSKVNFMIKNHENCHNILEHINLQSEFLKIVFIYIKLYEILIYERISNTLENFFLDDFIKVANSLLFDITSRHSTKKYNKGEEDKELYSDYLRKRINELSKILYDNKDVCIIEKKQMYKEKNFKKICSIYIELYEILIDEVLYNKMISINENNDIELNNYLMITNSLLSNIININISKKYNNKEDEKFYLEHLNKEISRLSKALAYNFMLL
jgi:hypothetical protein